MKECTMWKERIQALGVECTFRPSAMASELEEAEMALGVALPTDLKELLLESNGVLDAYQYGVVWPAEKIVSENRVYRTYPDFKLLYMPFDCLLFFGEEDNGDLYAYVITEGAIRRPDVFLWEHETDSRQWYAARMQNYLEQRLTSG
jgi:hypothetical protein